jgi:ribosome biogenesis GTPase / thiamine phosphate phosphatase
MFDPSHVATLQHIGLKPAQLQTFLQTPVDDDVTQPPTRLMRVTELHREHLLLHDGQDEHRARAHPTLIQQLIAGHDALAVGDWVLAAANGLAEWWVHQRLPPVNQMARRLHDGRDKVTRLVIVANVDTALLVMGLDDDFNLRRLERYLAAVRLSEIEPVVVLTKADLCPDAQARLQAVRALLPPTLQALAVNALDEIGVQAQLAPWLGSGQTLVLLGSSGAGKSTLTNALTGTDHQRTQANRDGDSRGRHTTTARSLRQLPAGGCIIDTPGLRTLRLDSESGGVQQVFDDIAQLAGACRFRDCRHQGEPGCAVQGGVDGARLRNFHKLQREAERDQMSALERKAQVNVWKVRAKAARERARDKR